MRPEVRRCGGAGDLALAKLLGCEVLVIERPFFWRFACDVCPVGWNRSGARRLARAVGTLVWVGRNTPVCVIDPNGAEAFWCLVALFEPLRSTPLLASFSQDFSFSVDFEWLARFLSLLLEAGTAH